MMNGIEILSQSEVVAKLAFNETVAWIIFSVLFAITIVVCAYFWINEGFSFGIIRIAIACFIASLYMGLMAGSIFSIPTAYKVQYKVTISGEVSMNEFLEKYEIIEQEDKIYTIEEKSTVN